MLKSINKKVLIVLFGLGMGVAASPAFASCAYFCSVEYRLCMKYAGNTSGGEAECYYALEECQAGC
jgi:hypothetical protein